MQPPRQNSRRARAKAKNKNTAHWSAQREARRDKQGQVLCDEAMNAFRCGDMRKAHELANIALKTKTDKGRPASILAAMMRIEGNHTLAQSYVDKGLTNTSEESSRLYLLATQSILDAEWEKALDLSLAAFNTDTTNDLAGLAAADAKLALGEGILAFHTLRHILMDGWSHPGLFTTMLRCLNNLCSSEYDEDLVQGATTYLNRPDLNPQLITPLISSLLAVKYAGVKVAKGVEALPPDLEINESQVPVQQIASDEFLINALNKINLAVPAMVPVICDLRRHLTSMILETSRIPEGYIALVCAIAHQSFHSGYLNFIEADERETLSSLAALLEKEIHEGRGDLTVLTPLILLYAMFLPLQNLGCFFELGERPLDHWPPCVRPLIRHIILDPIEERALARDIPRFAPIEDDISRKVQEQYEEHPYPRWTRIQAQPQPLSYQQRISARLFRGSRVTVLGPDAFSRTENFEVLVAGCGTGKHPAQVAKWCSNVSVVAVDLSRTSLGYAKRKTQCQEIRNIQFFHGDILNIHALGKTFPAIESIGVLHHMADPNEGLAALRNILAPRGILYLGLYSKRARQGVVAARKHIEALGLDPSNNNIRLLRHQILTGEKFAEYPELKSWLDLFYMSGVRDLLFHAQEHQFTPLQIKDLCETHNLKFLGFASLERKTVVAYRELFPEDTEMTSLANWDRFEQVHPQTFACMLNFICQAI